MRKQLNQASGSLAMQEDAIGATTIAVARLYRVPEAMRLLSLSRSVLYEQIRAGRLKSVTQGRTRLIPAAAIAQYVDLLQREADDGAA